MSLSASRGPAEQGFALFLDSALKVLVWHLNDEQFLGWKREENRLFQKACVETLQSNDIYADSYSAIH